MLCKKSCAKFKECTPYTLFLLRVVVGVIMIAHGWGKAQDVAGFAGNLTNMGIPLPTISAYLATAGELLGGLGLLLGVCAQLASFGIACTMAVAVFVVHRPNGLMASNGGIEYPLTLLAAALFFMTNGSGKWSLDSMICKDKCGGNEE